VAAPERPAQGDLLAAEAGGAVALAALLRLMRPRQWIKNLLVFASPAAAGVLDDPEFATRALVVFVAFCLAASGAYCLNDVADAEADRQHPIKRDRPVASGQVSPSVAVPLGIGLLIAGLLVAGLTGSWAPVGVVALYVALQPTYTYWLKHVAVIDMIVVAAGFVLRAVAGVVGTEIPVSNWYLIVASFGSLFLVASKRSTELRLGDAAVGHRGSLDAYTPSFLLLVRGVAVSITLLAYCLWAFEKASVADPWVPWFELSIVPFTALLFRYALTHETSELAGPEDIVLGDRQLQGIGVAWVACLAIGVYVAGAPPLPG
jgi:decaprenyl-phosphate phosphoribosyltransferase